MENIYGQTEKERNSIVSLPEGYADNAGNALYSWLGSLWRGLHKGDGMVRGLQSARGIRLAQMYVDILEAAKLKDRNGAPVFHLDLWHPIVIRRSEHDTAQENMLRLGGDGRQIGPQPPESDYGEGTVFKMGRMADYKDFVTYPVKANIAGGAMTIADNIVKPTVLMERGKDFELRNGSLIFARANDPFGDDSAFERYDIPYLDPDRPGEVDSETVLWASDVLIDRNYVSDHISYALGADAPSSDVVKRILNAAWSSVTCGLTPELIRTLMAAMLNVPVIQNDVETVTDISEEVLDDGTVASTVVRTDKGAYRVSAKARLRKGVYPGADLKRGDLLDESLRIYPCLDVDVNTGFSVPLEQDIPSVVIPPDMIRARTEHGVYALWGRSVVKRSKESPEDGNRNPHLYFDIGGLDSDVSAFWKDVWDKAESDGVSMESIVGPEGTLVSPAEFFLRNLVGANTIFVSVDRSQVDDISMMRNPMFFDMLSSVVPSAVRLFVVEHRSVGDEDRVDMDSAKEGQFLAAALPRASDVISEGVFPGMSGRPPSFGERVSARFVRPVPRKVRGSKEEEI